jgi:hypothetical protein
MIVTVMVMVMAVAMVMVMVIVMVCGHDVDDNDRKSRAVFAKAAFKAKKPITLVESRPLTAAFKAAIQTLLKSRDTMSRLDTEKITFCCHILGLWQQQQQQQQLDEESRVTCSRPREHRRGWQRVMMQVT